MIKKIILISLLVLTSTLTLLPTYVLADSSSVVKKGINDVSPGTPTDLNKTVTDAVKLLSVAVGIAAVIMIIVGGLRYVTSAGNAESAKSAKNTILYAIIGLAIAGVAQLIAHFVLTNVG